MNLFTRTPSRSVGMIAAVVTVLIWSSFIVIARAMALKSLTPLDIVLCRIIGASAVLVPLGIWWIKANNVRSSWLGVSPLSFSMTAKIGLLGGIGYAVLAYNGFIFAPAAHGSVLLPGMLPFWTAVASIVILSERLSQRRIIGLGLIMFGGFLVGGLSILSSLRDPSSANSIWRGDLFFLAASACWSLYAVLCRKHALQAIPATIAITFFALIVYVPVYLLAIGMGVVTSKLATAPWSEIIFQATWQGWMSVVISGISFTMMVQAYGPVRSTMLTALVPGLSALGAVVFLNEPLYWNLLAGLALVTLGIVVGVSPQKKGSESIKLD
jgi:drug/metabolite transporter (DMT)-like permease